MDTTETRKLIEYRNHLKVIRTAEILPVVKLASADKEETVNIPAKPLNRLFMPVDSKGYIKCKNHDFF